MKRVDAPIPEQGLLVTTLLIVRDQDRSRTFYADVLGGTVLRRRDPCFIRLANTWVILNSGGGPTPDKPDVTLAPPEDVGRAGSILNLRVPDVWRCYRDWSAKGAVFLTAPKDNHGLELRCYLRDPDGYLIEVGQATQGFHDLFRDNPA